MLPLREIDRFARTVDETWRSPVADAVAAAWGRPPGAARWWRSSATHVVVLPASDDVPRAYLRFAPADVVPRESVETVARLTTALVEDGLAIAPLLPSADGDVVTVATDLGPVHATCVLAARGSELDLDELTDARARTWGGVVAAFHDATDRVAVLAPDVVHALPTLGARLAAAAETLAGLGDVEAAVAARTVGDRLAGRDDGPGTTTVVHGDLELDNLAWDGDAVTVFDLDEATRAPHAVDLAHALRDLVEAGRPRPGLRRLHEAVVTGYLARRPALEPELADLPLLHAALAAVSAGRVASVLAEGLDLPDDVLPDLRTRLAGLLAGHRRDLLAAVAP
ncbi:phosphotransferase [Actinotalea ferrariae]|uniref:phosphotransferase enzyme family protein n=1 Tax=Actinotalea ferrariae TaxID=1386098 RepID=UPI001C8CCB87|nr:phosphotransferase [Actinotalea ferrariae]MBX9246191.1 phosphotransferase [Actinotalea ferrariae]